MKTCRPVARETIHTRGRQNHVKTVTLLGVTLMLGSFWMPVMARDLHPDWAPPEVIYSEDLKYTFTLHRNLNINRAGFNELLSLPGFDEDLALKVLRCRPFKNMHELQRKLPPSIDRGRLSRIITRIAAEIAF